MNRRLSRAKELISEGASLAVVNAAGELTYTERGVKTLLSLPQGSLSGAFIADKIIGKAAAMLLVRGGALEVYAEVISEPALAVLKAHKIICLYAELVPAIKNRDGSGLCPMEQAVLGIDDAEIAYELLKKKAGEQ